ncbi:2847_t:CDS:1, partial [Dentiscutata heterogama]
DPLFLLASIWKERDTVEHEVISADSLYCLPISLSLDSSGLEFSLT